MKKYFILAALLLLTLSIAGFFIYTLQKHNAGPINENNTITLYSSEKCPHCQKVEKFLQENNAENKLQFKRLPIDNNRENFDKLLWQFKACKLTGDKIPIPFLWTGKECIHGAPAIIKFFQDKLKNAK